MAYLDQQTVRFQPQWWTAAVYKEVPGRGYVFQKYVQPNYVKWSYFMDIQLNYPSRLGYRLYPFYWDKLAGSWIRDSGARFSGSADIIGALERRSPLPRGRYWQDIFEKQASDWNTWLSAALKSGAVKIVKAEHYNADPLHDGSWLPVPLQPDNAGVISDRMWILFDVVTPIDWPATKLGFPTIATSDVQTSADTAQNPPGPSISDELKADVMEAVKPALYIGGAYLAIKLLLGLRK